MDIGGGGVGGYREGKYGGNIAYRLKYGGNMAYG
jgi:hypothetical protein